MDVSVTGATAGELDRLAALAARTQTTPMTGLPGLGDDAPSVAAEVAGVDDWEAATRVARSAGEIVGWLLAETDRELHRVWWWGPVISPDADWDAVAGALYGAARRDLDPYFDQEEACGDERNEALARFTARHGFQPDEPSALLRRAAGATTPDPRVAPLVPTDADAVAELHDQLFPDTHTTGRQLVAKTDGLRMVLRDGPELVGYIAVEVLADGVGYIDFVGVRPDRHGAGDGSALVATALDELGHLGVTQVDLTVRVDNLAARSLYRRLGFEERQLLRPYRKGFSLDP